MNLLEHKVIEVLESPHISDDGRWRTIIKVNCWGCIEIKEKVGRCKEDLDLFKVGYIWNE